MGAGENSVEECKKRCAETTKLINQNCCGCLSTTEVRLISEMMMHTHTHDDGPKGRAGTGEAREEQKGA